MSDISKDDLHELKNDLKEFFDLKFSTLPCHQHDDALTRLDNKTDMATQNAQEAYTEAQLAKADANTAKDLATGNFWKLARIGMASVCAGAGFKMAALAHRLIEWSHHAK